MKLKASFFAKSQSKDLLIKNYAYLVLDGAEKYREKLGTDFKFRRFNALKFFLEPERKINAKEIIDKIQDDFSENKNLQTYTKLKRRLITEKDRQVLDRVYSGDSIASILDGEKISFDDFLVFCRNLESVSHTEFYDNKVSPIAGVGPKDFEELHDRERVIMTLFSMGISDAARIGELLSKETKSVTKDLATARKSLKLNAAKHEASLRKLETLNIQDRLKLFYHRLFDFISDPELKEKILFANDKDVFKAGKFINEFRVHIPNKQTRWILRRKLWHYTNAEIISDFKKKNITINKHYIHNQMTLARKYLEKSVDMFFQNQDSLPKGINGVYYVLLTKDQRLALNLYLQGYKSMDITKLMKHRNKSIASGLIHTARKKLLLSKDQLLELREANLKDLKLLQHLV